MIKGVTVKFVTISVMLAMLLGACFLFLRKDMPYEFRFVNLDGDMLIHNKIIWNKRSLDIKYSTGDRYGDAVLDGGTNSAIIKKIKTGEKIKLEITRKDFIGRLLYKSFKYNGVVSKPKNRYIAFIGASIGRDWKLENLPERINKLNDLEIFYWPEYKFNKKTIIDHILKIPIKPHVIMIKECAEYFPRNEIDSINEINSWFEIIKNNKILPVALTTFSVTKQHDDEHTGKAASINKFNGLLKKSGYSILELDLQLADSQNRIYLSEKYAQKDGLHLNKYAYEKIDKLLTYYLKR